MPQRLRVSEIMTVGFVGKGDNPPAEVVFFKRAPDEAGRGAGSSGKSFRGRRSQDPAAGPPVGTHENEEETLMSKFRGVLTALGLTKDDVVKALEEGELDDGEAADPVTPEPPPATPPKADTDPEPDPAITTLQKSLDEVSKRAEQAEQMVQKLRDEKENREYVEKAGKLGALPGVTADDFGPLLRKIAGALDEEEFGKLEQALQSANETIRTSGVFGEFGRGGSGSTTVEAQVTEKAEEIRKADPSLSAQQARAKVWAGHPELLAAYERERAANVRRAQITAED